MDPAELRARLAANVNRIRRRRGMSLRQLAELAGLGHATVVLVAGARSSCTMDTLAKLADALDVEPETLLGPPRR